MSDDFEIATDGFEGAFTEEPFEISDGAALAVNGGKQPAYITRLNKSYAVVQLDAKIAILVERPGKPAVFMTPTDLHLWYANDTITIGRRKEPVSMVWLQHPHRRQYEDVVFDPRDTNPAHYNLWQGFAVQPDAKGSCERWLHHIKNNICSGNEEHFRWVLGFLAHMVQRPWEKPGVALVLQGKEGAGKGFFANVIGRLCPHHYVVVSQAAHLTGRFNAHCQQCLVMFVDEGFWAGDKHGEGALKHLVTDHELLIEPKHVNPFMIRNVVRMVVASNEHWVVPAGTNARRWFVLKVADTYANDRKYFSAIEAELDAGGLQAFIHLLQTFDLSEADIYTAPKTAALLEQKIETMAPHDRWWLQCLQEGEITGADQWPAEIVKEELWESYQRFVLDHNIRTRIWPNKALHKWMRQNALLPGSQETRPGTGDRRRVINLPGLEDCRTAYAR
jgi:hypothetical protein